MVVFLFMACAAAGGACLVVGRGQAQRGLRRVGYGLLAAAVVIAVAFVVGAHGTHTVVTSGVSALTRP